MYEFNINGMTYHIKECSTSEIYEAAKKDDPELGENTFFFGLCRYAAHEILINEDQEEEEKINTLRHEMTHCWLFNFGYRTAETFSQEALCDIVAACGKFVFDETKNYFTTKLEKTCKEIEEKLKES